MFEYYSESVDGYDYGSIDTYYNEVINIFPQTASDISKPQVIKPTTTLVVSTLEPSVVSGGPSTVVPPAVKQNFEIFPYQILDDSSVGAQPNCNLLESKCEPKVLPKKENFIMYPNSRLPIPSYQLNGFNGLNDNTMIIIMFIILLFLIMYQKIKIENLKFMLKCLAREKYNNPISPKV